MYTRIGLLPLFLLSVFSHAQEHDQKFKLNLSNFSDFKSIGRTIEPTSPILGHQLSEEIKNSNIHPEIIFGEIIKSNPALEINIRKSVTAYLNTMKPGLDEYCSGVQEKTSLESSWTTVDQAAIPQEVILPLQESYLSHLNSSIEENSCSTAELTESSSLLASDFQKTRYACKTAQHIRDLEDKAEKYCLFFKSCKKAKKINSIISSAEAAYPRKQFSINGFTRYVFDELLKHDFERLAEILKTVYDLEAQWFSDFKNKKPEQDFFEYVVFESIEHDVHVKDAFLVLAYSMRNMPSLDIEYAESPQKALLLEAYFWGFKDLRNELYKKDYDNYTYPKHDFKTNPGAYHYLTAALLGCEARLSGLSHTTATMMGLASKIGYKTDKLLKSIDKEKYKKDGLKYVKSIMKQQAYWPGVGAGFHAAKFGSKACKGYMRKLKKDMKEEYKSELKKEYRSVLDEEK